MYIATVLDKHGGAESCCEEFFDRAFTWLQDGGDLCEDNRYFIADIHAGLIQEYLPKITAVLIVKE